MGWGGMSELVWRGKGIVKMLLEGCRYLYILCWVAYMLCGGRY